MLSKTARKPKLGENRQNLIVAGAWQANREFILLCVPKPLCVAISLKLSHSAIAASPYNLLFIQTSIFFRINELIFETVQAYLWRSCMEVPFISCLTWRNVCWESTLLYYWQWCSSDDVPKLGIGCTGLCSVPRPSLCFCSPCRTSSLQLSNCQVSVGVSDRFWIQPSEECNFTSQNPALWVWWCYSIQDQAHTVMSLFSASGAKIHMPDLNHQATYRCAHAAVP